MRQLLLLTATPTAWQIVFITIIMVLAMVGCAPINNGFSVKFNPTSRDNSIPKSFRALFNLPHESSPAVPELEALDHVFYPHTAMLRPGCSNQIAKMLFPSGYNGNSHPQEYPRFNLPVVPQPYTDYKVVVATAPPHLKLNGEESEPIVIYVIFTDDDTDGASGRNIQIPTIYFMRKKNGEIDLETKEKVDPILIVDSNRTVTGLKSTNVAKFVKFKSRFLDRIDTVDEKKTAKSTNSSGDLGTLVEKF